MPRRRIRVVKRDYKAEYARRQAKAKALGYENYYARRIRVGAPPSAPKPTGAELARARGHRSAADLKRLLRGGDVGLLNTQKMIDKKGRVVVDVKATTEDGREYDYRLSEEQARTLRDLLRTMGPEAPMLVGSPRTLAAFEREPEAMAEAA